MVTMSLSCFDPASGSFGGAILDGALHEILGPVVTPPDGTEAPHAVVRIATAAAIAAIADRLLTSANVS